jgi:hypothetical protein
VVRRERDDFRATGGKQRVGADQQRHTGRQRVEGILDLAIGARFQHIELHSEFSGRRLEVCGYRLGAGVARLQKRRDAGGLWHKLTQQAQPLWSHLRGQRDDSSGIAARPIETLHEAQSIRRVGDQEINWDIPGRVSGGDRRHCRGQGCDHRHLALNQVRRHVRQPIFLSVSPAEFDRDVLSLDKAGFAQAFPQSGHAPGVWPRRSGVQKSDHRHRGLLRARGERPHHGTAKSGDEFSSLNVDRHSCLSYLMITASATAKPSTARR